jgi:hypothetical protein
MPDLNILPDSRATVAHTFDPFRFFSPAERLSFSRWAAEKEIERERNRQRLIEIHQHAVDHLLAERARSDHA